MTGVGVAVLSRLGAVRRSRRATMASDLLLAVGFTVAAVGLHRARVDGVSENRASDLFSTLLTVLAVAPLVVRRARPLPVLVVCATGLVGLVAGRYVVSAAPVGVLVAFYSVAAWGSSRAAARAVAVVAVALVATVVLRPVDLSLEGMVVNGVLLVVGWVLGSGVRERRALHEAQVGAAVRELDLERERADRARVEERLRISRELHDVVGHAMSVMVVQAGAAQHLLATRPDLAADALARITDTGRDSLAQIRQLLTAVRSDDETDPRPDEFPGLAALPALAARMTSAGLPVRLACEVDGDLPPGVALAAYRIVQEALTNTLRHAGPATATVAVTRVGVDLRIEVTDDGHGAEPHAAEGRGLDGMRERVAVYGGDLTTGSAAGGGYRVYARIPVQSAPPPGGAGGGMLPVARALP